MRNSLGLARKNKRGFQARLAAYSTGVGAALVAASPAQATIALIDRTNLTFDGTSVASISPTLALPTSQNSGGASFKFGSGFPTFHFYFENGFATHRVAMTGGVAVTSAVGNDKVINFDLGNPIVAAGNRFASYGPNLVSGPNNSKGNFAQGNGRDSYVGFRFSHSAKSYYGWLKVQFAFDSDGVPLSVSLVPKTGTTDIFGAYGDNTMTAGAVPEPSSVALAGLGLLALGAAGVREMRRRRQAIIA